MVEESKDRYGRNLIWIIVEGDTINSKMVEDGYAWWYEYYCGDNKELERLHNNAKSRKLAYSQILIRLILMSGGRAIDIIGSVRGAPVG